MAQRSTVLRACAAVLALGLLHPASPGRGEELRPNFVLVLVDDLGWTDLGCQGSGYYETPHVDRLAAEGMRFTNAYAACAVCSPTRYAVQTGRYPARSGITDWIRARFQGGTIPEDRERPSGYVGGPRRRLLCPRNALWMEREEVTIAELLSAAGYATCHIGKWHLGADPWFPDRQGYDVNLGGTDAGQPPSYFDPYAGGHELTTLPPRREGEYLTDREADEAVAFISAHDDEPFFLSLCHYAVHTPIQAKPELVARYRAKETTNHGHAAYAAMVHSVDEALGRVRAALETHGLTERTWIVFTSDNGGLEPVTDNAPLRAGKGHPYEGGVRVPFIACRPGTLTGGVVVDVPVSSVDILPTLCAAARVELPADLVVDGLDLRPVLLGEGAVERDALFWHFPHYRSRQIGPYSIIRRGAWKLIRRYEGEPAELYDLSADPGEQHDLAAAKPDRVRELEARLSAWLEETAARVPRPNPGFRSPGGRIGVDSPPRSRDAGAGRREERMVHRVRSATVFVLLLALLSVAAPAGRTEEAPSDHDQRMAWWREARFGMFIHWGLYAIPAGAWEGSTGHAEWIQHTARIPVARYEALREQFNPVAFDAARWAAIAKNAGMKYVVITSKHHDGFCLFDSEQTDYDVMSTPFRRDVMKELSEACRAAGLEIGWYHSIMDWHHPDYLPRRGWETRSADGADFSRYLTHLHRQVEELLTNYGRIGVMWFDGEWEPTWTHEHGVALYDRCRRLQPTVIVNNRVDKGRAGMAGLTRDGEFAGDFGTPEQEIPATGLPDVDWETCMTMNGHWGFNAQDQAWKSSEDLIRKLADIASKGGNFLLNVGPTATGEFPPASIERLEAMGRWMRLNAESIHGTHAGPFRRLPWGRSTAKPGRLYLHVFRWPADGVLRVPGLLSEVRSARLLADEDRTPLDLDRDADGVLIAVPAEAPDRSSSVVVLEIDGAPEVEDVPIRAGVDGTVRLPAAEAVVHGRTARYEEGGGKDNIGFWTDAGDWVEWEFRIDRPGRFRIEIEYACIDGSGGSEVAISVGDRRLTHDVEETGSWTDFASASLGEWMFAEAGRYARAVTPVSKPGLAVMNLRAVRLVPIARAEPPEPLPPGYTIPVVDLAADTERQVIVDREAGQYLGHPTTVLLEDGKTMLCVYPKGHGRGAIVMKRSTDGGRTWSERLPVPENWATSKEVPTIHRVVDADGTKRLILFSGLHPTRMAVSEDDGATWSPLEPVGAWGGIVVMGCVAPLRTGAGHYLAMFHDDGRFFPAGGQVTGTMTLYKTFSEDGGLTWSFPEEVYANADIHLCEPGLVRSPDGARIAVLLRENRRRRNSHVIFSDDEGKTFTEPRELPAALTGDRHTGRYAPDGRLFLSFRDTARESTTQGDWVGWVGTFEDIEAGREGQYRVRIMDNHHRWDCAYPGVELLPDGTFVTTTYGHWTEGESPYVVSVRFRLDEIDARAGRR